MRNDQPQRISVIGRQRLTIVVRRQQNLFAIKIREGNIGSKPLLGMHLNISRIRFGTSPSQQFLKRHAVPPVIEATPARDTVKIAAPLHFGQSVELIPGET